MFSPNDLDAFCKVAQMKTMSRVAEAEGKSVMAVSKQIKRLETSLNEALFLRSRRELILTEFGQAFRQKAEVILAQHRELAVWTQQRETTVCGELNVICQSNEVVTETIVPWLSAFTRLYPELAISLDVKESLINIKEDDFDIFWGVGRYLGEQFPGLKRRSIWRTRYGIFASPDYLDQFGTPETPEDLSHHQVIGYLHNKPGNVLVLQNKNGEPIYATPRCQIKTVAGLVELAEAGLGLINAPAEAGAIRALLEGKSLQPVLTEYWWDDAEIYAYYHPTNPEQKKVRAFLDFFFDKRAQWLSDSPSRTDNAK